MRREDGVTMTATAGRNLLFYAQKKGLLRFATALFVWR
jgi:hypothetical protein